MQINLAKSVLVSKQETNINNTNNTNNTNNFNDTNFNDCFQETIKQISSVTPAASSGLASLSASQDSGEVICSGVGNPSAPRGWRGLKLDLFQNGLTKTMKPSYKLKLGIIKPDGTLQSLVANLNSPPRYIWRKVDVLDRANIHWNTVADIMQIFEDNNIDFRASKCALPHKSSGTEVVAFLSQTEQEFVVTIVIDAVRYDYSLPKQGTVNQIQKNANCIASKFIGKESTPLLSTKDLGI
jgi:hypothetical protein